MLSRYFLVLITHVVCIIFLYKVLSCLLPGFVTSCYLIAVNFVTYVLIASFTFRLTRRRFLGKKVRPRNKAVLITGCGHGFGNLLAKKLDSRGFHVFASVRDPLGEGVAELKKSCSDRLEILKLDVREDESVKDAVVFVKEHLGSSELWAVVNNAGIYRGVYTVFSDIQDFKDCMDVNLYGAVRVTKAFLPLLKKSRGRIIDVSSLAGRIPAPAMTVPYISSKFAAVGFTECLRQELDVWGIRVISVEPEIFRTQMSDWNVLGKQIDKSIAAAPEEVKTGYGDFYFIKLKAFAKNFIQYSSSNVHKVIDDLESAVSLEYPDTVYRPCRNTATYVLMHYIMALPISVRDFSFKCTFRYFLGCPIPKCAQKYS